MSHTEDITTIAQLVVCERESRDMGFWNRMRDCFHPDAEINISWFKGSGPEFVEASKDMAAHGMLAKHRLGPVHVILNGDRALASVGGIIDIPTVLEGKDFILSAYSVFWYRAERRAGRWRLSSFECFYRRDEFQPAVLGTSVSLPVDQMQQYRPSYRNLCYSLHMKGYAPDNDLPGEDRPETVRAMLQRLFDWLGLPVPS